MTQLSLVPKHWLHLQCACCRHQANVPVATFIGKGLQTIAQIKNKSRCCNCGRRGRVELVIYFRTASDFMYDVGNPDAHLSSSIVHYTFDVGVCYRAGFVGTFFLTHCFVLFQNHVFMVARWNNRKLKLFSYWVPSRWLVRSPIKFSSRISVNAEKNENGRRFVCCRYSWLTHPPLKLRLQWSFKTGGL